MRKSVFNSCCPTTKIIIYDLWTLVILTFGSAQSVRSWHSRTHKRFVKRLFGQKLATPKAKCVTSCYCVIMYVITSLVLLHPGTAILWTRYSALLFTAPFIQSSTMFLLLKDTENTSQWIAVISSSAQHHFLADCCAPRSRKDSSSLATSRDRQF